MIDVLAVLVTGLLVIAAASIIGPRVGIATPLVLVAIGVAASYLPMFASIHIEPEWILAGLLPPLLYSAAVSMPAMNFRREFGAISGLSVLLVIGTALVLGLFFTLVIPGLDFAWGVALGAIISPTDAVATSIIKRAPVSKRVVAILEGESLLNDATALVLLRTAIVAAAASFSFWGALGTFAYSVVIAVAVGGLAGWLNLAARKRITNTTASTVISFTVPFVAAVPAEMLSASGLVAAVVAGLVSGIRGPRDLSPQTRLSDSQNWRTVEFVLEGVVFLTMGMQMRSIVADVTDDHAGMWQAVLIAVAALVLTILVRAAYVAPLLGLLARRARHIDDLHTHLTSMQEQMSTPEGKREAFAELNPHRAPRSERDLNRLARRVAQGIADLEYFVRAPLGWREGAVVVWAGMRGAVTVAAALTLPQDAPQRSVLVLIGFAVAATSLALQGGTIAPLLRLLTTRADSRTIDQQPITEQRQITELLQTTAESVPFPLAERQGTSETTAPMGAHQLAVITAQRVALLNARDNGTFDADLLANELAKLDASQIAIETGGRPV